MKHGIATVSLSGMLREKLQAAAAAHFDGVEIFENDLLQYPGTPAEVRRMCQDLGLAIDMFQPFRDFDGSTQAQVQRNLERAQRKFDVMDELGTSLILVCSNVQPDALGDAALLAEQFQQLAELAGQRKAIDADFEFYKSDPAKAPASLKRRLEEHESSVAVQKRFIADQEAEKKRVNLRFDEELVKLNQLWAMGGVVPAATAAPTVKK